MSHIDSAYNDLSPSQSMNCRSIHPDDWAHARKALVRYFASRHARADAEDLAQATLERVLEREDYEFGSSADFLKVCLGFARHVRFENARRERRAPGALDFEAATPSHAAESHHANESRIMLDDVRRVGSAHLNREEWSIVREAAEGSKTAALDAAEANRTRVFLHRARRKLARLTGWRKK
jgi:DNA-directed RNA polymerase specialized sigma24 family protein